jgi:hypothetical protein
MVHLHPPFSPCSPLPFCRFSKEREREKKIAFRIRRQTYPSCLPFRHAPWVRGGQVAVQHVRSNFLFKSCKEPLPLALLQVQSLSQNSTASVSTLKCCRKTKKKKRFAALDGAAWSWTTGSSWNGMSADRSLAAPIPSPLRASPPL